MSPCSELHFQKGLNLIVCSYKTLPQVSYPDLFARQPSVAPDGTLSFDLAKGEVNPCTRRWVEIGTETQDVRRHPANQPEQNNDLLG